MQNSQTYKMYPNLQYSVNNSENCNIFMLMTGAQLFDGLEYFE